MNEVFNFPGNPDTTPAKLVVVDEQFVVALGKALDTSYQLRTLDPQEDVRVMLHRYHAWHDQEGEFAPKAGEPVSMVIIPSEEVWKRVRDVKPGDRLDLQGDSVADPDNENVSLEFELFLVEEIERETDDCIVFYSQTSGGNFAFPADHLVKYASHDFGFEPEAEPTIHANAWTDDRKIEVSFKVNEWFAQASPLDLIELSNSLFQRCVTADSIIQFYASDETKRIMNYATAVGDDMGYEAEVNIGNAMKWIRQHRADVYVAIIAEMPPMDEDA